MRLVMATADFLVAGRPFAGFPLLLNEDGWPMEPAHSFLWQALITHGGVESKLTWELAETKAALAKLASVNHVLLNEVAVLKGIATGKVVSILRAREACSEFSQT